ncbi:Zn-ribbon domain-containing OB-fold protein [Halobacterium sp. R2-5]|uniref:Zn-ribbon domain-containing OB-fold protein n=1 Tax=Halobacterium sp. R2-5 TaxID=2715751 RepID=UPI00141EA584|nr:Zn-ribbon domain-containing OB-fold protein [Halobacterium sp. R2-5]NIB98866.1 Zn-ribbon domain-containing OB-fold protein [Halobacterium sp. R2-5]
MTDTSEERVRDAGFDDLLDALAEGDGYYLACANGHGSLPPRRVCPECGSTDLDEEPLPETGEVATYTQVHVPAPSFADDAPYVTAVVDFGPVRLTGQVLADYEDVEIGTEVAPTVGETETNGERLVRFELR